MVSIGSICSTLYVQASRASIGVSKSDQVSFCDVDPSSLKGLIDLWEMLLANFFTTIGVIVLANCMIGVGMRINEFFECF